MKVLILTPNYPRRNALMNGVFIHQQVKALHELGVECHVLLLHNWYPGFRLHKHHPHWQYGYEQHKTYFEEYEGIRIHHIPVFHRMPDRLFKNNYYNQAAKAVVKYVSNNRELKNAEWLYAHFLTDYAYIAAIAKQKLNVKLAAIARGDDVHAWPEQNAFLVQHLKHVFANADLLLANSGRLAADTKHWMDADAVREVKVVYNGISYDKYYPVSNMAEKKELLGKYGLSGDFLYMICVATPVALKGWNELLGAIKKLGNKLDGWKLLMVAPNRSAPDALNLELISKELEITDRVVFMGQVDPGNLSELYRACDVFVLPSYNEGMANALLEAMSSGLACITTNVGGHAEVIETGLDGMLIAPKNIGELTAALDKVCNDVELIERLGDNARKRILHFGNYAKNAQRLYAYFENHE